MYDATTSTIRPKLWKVYFLLNRVTQRAAAKKVCLFLDSPGTLFPVSAAHDSALHRDAESGRKNPICKDRPDLLI